MNIFTMPQFKSSVITAALILASTTPAYATVYNITGKFQMWSGQGSQTGTDDFTITGTYDDTDPTSMRISTTQKFFGFIWDAHDLVVTPTSGNVTVDACPVPADGSVVPKPGTTTGEVIPCTPPLLTSMDIGANQWGVQMLFDWNTSFNIDVLNVWDVTINPDGSIRLLSTDFDNDGIAGQGMVDGAFQTFNANFDLLLSPPFPVSISASQGLGVPVLLDPAGAAGNVTFDATIIDPAAISITYDWSGSDAAITAAAIGGTNNATLIIDQTDAGLIAGQTYTIEASVTKTLASGASTSSTNQTIKVASFALAATDTDLDGTNDNIEGFIDTDGDRIPEFLDVDATVTRLTINPADNTLGNINASEGTLRLGETSYQNAITNLNAATSNDFGAAISVSTIGENDDNFFKSFCTGGCFDISVTNISNSTIQLTIPVSTALPEHALFRVHTTSGWNGFIIDDNNTTASAAANSTNPIDCPAVGLVSYTTGLTAGHRCIQLTIEDGGPNDSDGIANGSISLQGGAAELIITAPATNGVGVMWFLLFLFPALSGFRYFRKLSI